MPAPDQAVRDLKGVPETMLWPLWNRAAEAARPDCLIHDPMAVEVVARIDYDFRGHFGRPSVFHAVRARVGDDLIRAYLARDPKPPVVVALGEGLETQFWRIGDDTLRWFSVDLAEAVRCREALLPNHPSVANLSCSALDPAWIDEIPASAEPFISAAGLLMYFPESEVRNILAHIAERLPGAEIFFDTIPPSLSARTLRGMKVTRHYTAPPMPWGIGIGAIRNFLRSVPNLETVSVQDYTEPFPRRAGLYRVLSGIAVLRRRFAPALVHARVRKPKQ